MTEAERKALIELWRDVPGTQPPSLALPNATDEVVRLYLSASPFNEQAIAALARDQITMYIIGEGYFEFEWYHNSDHDMTTLDIGRRDEPVSGKTPLACLIAAARAVQGGER